jgi:predicted glycosyltransferase involved in capsule biosynthesis
MELGSYFRAQSKSQQFRKIKITTLYHIRPQQNKIRTQQQKKPQKIFKLMETEQQLLNDQI